MGKIGPSKLGDRRKIKCTYSKSLCYDLTSCLVQQRDAAKHRRRDINKTTYASRRGEKYRFKRGVCTHLQKQKLDKKFRTITFMSDSRGLP